MLLLVHAWTVGGARIDAGHASGVDGATGKFRAARHGRDARRARGEEERLQVLARARRDQRGVGNAEARGDDTRLWFPSLDPEPLACGVCSHRRRRPRRAPSPRRTVTPKRRTTVSRRVPPMATPRTTTASATAAPDSHEGARETKESIPKLEREHLFSLSRLCDVADFGGFCIETKAVWHRGEADSRRTRGRVAAERRPTRHALPQRPAARRVRPVRAFSFDRANRREKSRGFRRFYDTQALEV